VDDLVRQEGDGASRMEDLVLLFNLLKDTTDDHQRRTLREQLSAGVNQVVERSTLYPIGWIAMGTKEDWFIDVLFRNGAERRIEAGEC